LLGLNFNFILNIGALDEPYFFVYNNSMSYITKTGRLLPAHKMLDSQGLTSEYATPDTEDLFLKNLKIQPANWHYKTNKVNYRVNSDGYRTKEFDSIDWANSVVIFGCSEVFGTGVDESHTVASFLSDLIKLPVINLGVSGSSIMFSLHNSLLLNNLYPTPKAVVHLWTEYSRVISYDTHGLTHHGSWDLDKDNYMIEWAFDDINPATYASFCQMTSHQIWKDKTVYYEATPFPATATLFDCEHLIKVDHARDLVHSGIVSKKAMAMKIAKNIIKEFK